MKPENAWDQVCEALATATTTNTVTQARFDVCAANGEVNKNDGSSPIVAAGASLFDPVCADAVATIGTTIVMAQGSYCADDNNAWNGLCNTLADADDVNPVAQARARVCADNGAIADATANNVAAGESLFGDACKTLMGAAPRDGYRRRRWCIVQKTATLGTRQIVVASRQTAILL